MKKLLSFLLLIALLFSLLSCRIKDSGDEYSQGDVYEIHTSMQAGYLADTYTRANKYASGNGENSRPLPITLSWGDNLSEGSFLLLSESETLDPFARYAVSGTSLNVYNLKIGTTYYYGLFDTESTKIGETKSFKTDAACPRNLYVDGVTNVRDLGGWQTEDGGTVKQGMIYRTAKYSEDETGTLLITAEGIRVMTEELGVRTEIDLRRTDNNENAGITESPLGSSVAYVSFPMQSSGDIMTLNADNLPVLFAIFGDESNYPIAFHCSIGTDRTGYVAFLLNALLGVPEEALYRDYLFSNFGDIGGTRFASVIDGYCKAIDKCDGATFAEKTYRYLTGVGVSTDDLDRYIALMKRK